MWYNEENRSRRSGIFAFSTPVEPWADDRGAFRRSALWVQSGLGLKSASKRSMRWTTRFRRGDAQGGHAAGTLRSRLYNKGRYVDVELYAILRKDGTSEGGRASLE